MAKEYNIKCENCGKAATKKSPKSKYCSKACNQRAYEKRNNKKAPSFVSQIDSNKNNRVAKIQIPSFYNNEITSIENRNITELDILKDEKNKLLIKFNRLANRKGDLKNKIGMLAAIGGMVQGSKMIEKDDTALGIFFKLVGVPFIFNLVGKGVVTDVIFQEDPNLSNKLDSIKLQIDKVNEKITSIQLSQLNIPSARKNSPQTITVDNHPEVLNSAQYKSVDIPSIQFDKNSVWYYLLGQPKENFHLLLSGAAGQGKTTFAVKFANHFNKNHGEVIYLTSEQSGLDLNFQEMLKRYNCQFNIHARPKGKSLAQISKSIAGHRLAIIDSINHIGYSVEDLEELKKLNPKTAFVTIMQNTKDGKFKGDNQYLHNSDTHVEMVNLVAHVRKNRSGKLTKAPMDDSTL